LTAPDKRNRFREKEITEMAKRFTDTDKWKDEWFTELDPILKILWIYITDTCDHAGFWKVNFRLASYCLNSPVDKQSAINAFSQRVDVLSDDIWFIKKFIRFQYGVPLNIKNNAHKGVLKSLEKHRVETSPYIYLVVTHEGLVTKPYDSLGDMDKDMDMDMDMDKDKDSSSLSFLNTKSALKIDTVIQLFNDMLANTKTGKISFCRDLSAKQREDFITTTSFKDFQTLETWREIFEKVKSSEFLIGNSAGFVATLNWLVIHGNALKVLNGQYSGTPDKQNGTQKAFKLKTNGTVGTPENPTGNPYTAQRLARENGEIA